MTFPNSRRAHVYGLGLIGGSLARALTTRGWIVSGSDIDGDIEQDAVKRDFVTSTKCADGTDLVLLATPAETITSIATSVLATTRGPVAVSDVAGVKVGIVDSVLDGRFIGGHPMAGSEAVGLKGARDDLFRGRTWVLTPTALTDPRTFCTVFTAATDMGAHVISLEPAVHDRLVALMSHVPHLIAGALVTVMGDCATNAPWVRDLAAGGFRDMTRVAAGDSTIWPEVLIANAVNIRATLDDVRDYVSALSLAIERGDRDEIQHRLAHASVLRSALPATSFQPSGTHAVTVTGAGQPGVVAVVAICATASGVTLVGASMVSTGDSVDDGLRVVTGEAGAKTLHVALRDRGLECTVVEL
jgi:prephenate dehydrogenase